MKTESRIEFYNVLCVGCFSAKAMYLFAVALLALLPHLRSGNGMSITTQTMAAVSICTFRRPMPAIQGLSAKSTATEKMLRVKMMPTIAEPTIYNTKC